LSGDVLTPAARRNVMEQDRPDRKDEPAEPPPSEQPPSPPPPLETVEELVPGVEHKPEPDAENIMPAKHEPGTL
jgi:hypothetical protein